MSVALLSFAACSPGADADPAVEQVGEQAAQPQLGLMSTLPIYWNEAVEFSDLLNEGAGTNWVRSALERDYAIEPLDVLTPDTLAPLERLILAQPRSLSPEENVALDDWVRGGGQVILFADPMLTRHSEYRLGDPRRPHDVALLSPILARWGLELQFDARQAEGERTVEAFGISVPVQSAGQFVASDGGAAQCSLSQNGVMAQCRIGKGSALLLADAALLDEEHGHEAEEPMGQAASDADHAMREDALRRLIASAFPA